jgi:hypothetical protein
MRSIMWHQKYTSKSRENIPSYFWSSNFKRIEVEYLEIQQGVLQLLKCIWDSVLFPGNKISNLIILL